MQEEFDYFVQIALDEMPIEFKDKLDNVGIFVENFPTTEQAHKLRLREKNTLLFGLYEGIPQNKRAHYGVGGAVPDKITLFRIPILKISRSKQELIENIKSTLYHEIGHHFGMSEEEIRRATMSLN